MAVIYFVSTVIFLGMNASDLPHAAFLKSSPVLSHGTAAAGGFAGATHAYYPASGIARGVYLQ
jgi:Na+/alanine symporter